MKKVLVIEDNNEMRDNIAEMIELANYNVVSAENGKVGVEIAKKEKPDLIICDIMMPELDGYGVLHILSKNDETARIPFIFLSAKADKSEVRKGMNLGADDYLTKPFDRTELLDAIEVRLKRSEFHKKRFAADFTGFTQFINEAKAFSLPENFAADYKIRNFKNKEIIYNEGDLPNNVYLINKGKIKTSKMNEGGKEFITGMHGSGEFFGYISILEGSEYSDYATTMENSEVVVIPKQDFLTLIQSNADVSAQFIKMLANNIAENEERLLGLAYNSVRARVANVLIQLQKKNSEQNNSIIVYREDLANIVGTSTESLIRTLSDFKSEKMIVTEGREIKITNLQGLEKVKKIS
ncbi:MAG TPA: response regulator [Bacteroidia bacterium]|nr:response regulator [Bacteroidia bacterium]